MLKRFTSFCSFIIKQFAFLISVLLSVLILPVTVFSQSANPRFELLTAMDGLSHNKVQCILRDKQAYLWFGTIYGLNRYDGYSFKVFENIPGDSSSIGNNNIISLYQDKTGIIWAGTSTIIAAYNPQTEKFTNYNLPAAQGWVHGFSEDEDGVLWIATGDGLFSFDHNREKIIYHKTDALGKENTEGILRDKKDKHVLWLSTETGIRKYDTKTKAIKNYSIPLPLFEDISREITHNIIEDHNGNIWMTSTRNGVYELNRNTEKLIAHNISAGKSSVAASKISTQIMEDSDGKMWIGSEGLCIFDPSTGSLSFDKMGINDNQGFSARVRAILKDRNGIYWIGTERGIAKYDPKLYSFSTIKPEYPFTLQSANTIIEDHDHTFWVGNYVGLGTVDPNTGVYKGYNHLLGEDAMLYTSIMDKDGAIWFGSESALFHLCKSAGNTWRSEKINLPVNRKIQVRSMAFSPHNFLWVGTNGGGLFRLDLSSKHFSAYMGDAASPALLSSVTIAALNCISADSLLIGTKGKGIILMNTGNRQFTKIDFIKKQQITSIDNAIINAIYRDTKNNIWIGTDGGGLWKTNSSLLSFTNYSVKNGLQSTSITQITEDDKEQIWLNTSLGLEIIDPLHNRFVHYSAKDGLSINQQDYLIKKSSGDLMRVDFNGLHIFHSSSINLNKEVPPVYINQIQILDKAIPVYKDTVIHLKYNENYISFSYAALNYTQSYKNRYAYRLEGLETKWIDAADRRFAAYANIGPGTYTFHVKASNNNGVWNEKGAKITFIISPSWWNTWWFYTLAVILVAAIIYTLFRLRLQQEIKAMEVRNTISRDLHDEVGSTLSSIGFLSSMALNDADENNAKILGTLNNINESSTRMLDVMNDIIWNIQPKNETVKNILARMVSFASDILEAKKINLHINIAENLDHLQLGLTERHNFYMIYKEAINNLAKYSNAAEAWVSLEFKHPYLVLEIRDNGRGFDPKNIRDGNGLRNMQSRAEKIGALYNLRTVLNEGTRITVQLKPS